MAELKSDLIAVINSEYESFIGLSLGLRKAQVSTSLATIKRPVLDIRNEIIAVKQVLDRMKSEMEDLLEQRKQIRESKALLRSLLEVEEAVEKVEGLLMLSNAREGSSKSRTAERLVHHPV